MRKHYSHIPHGFIHFSSKGIVRICGIDWTTSSEWVSTQIPGCFVASKQSMIKRGVLVLEGDVKETPVGTDLKLCPPVLNQLHS